ncbi:hypothetical protein M1146_05885 [Patescibacteria group bacterium]|nr:hypothetical protein [Patescibacteria group bacterium]
MTWKNVPLKLSLPSEENFPDFFLGSAKVHKCMIAARAPKLLETADVACAQLSPMQLQCLVAFFYTDLVSWEEAGFDVFGTLDLLQIATEMEIPKLEYLCVKKLHELLTKGKTCFSQTN